MTPSRTTLIEPNRLFRQGLKHLLTGSRFEVGVHPGSLRIFTVCAGKTGKE